MHAPPHEAAAEEKLKGSGTKYPQTAAATYAHDATAWPANRQQQKALLLSTTAEHSNKPGQERYRIACRSHTHKQMLSHGNHWLYVQGALCSQVWAQCTGNGHRVVSPLPGSQISCQDTSTGQPPARCMACKFSLLLHVLAPHNLNSTHTCGENISSTSQQLPCSHGHPHVQKGGTHTHTRCK